jgi:hypothetical protein
MSPVMAMEEWQRISETTLSGTPRVSEIQGQPPHRGYGFGPVLSSMDTVVPLGTWVPATGDCCATHEWAVFGPENLGTSPLAWRMCAASEASVSNKSGTSTRTLAGSATVTE